MFFDDLTVEQKVLFTAQLRKYYPKREVDLHSLFIKVIKIDKHSIHELERLRQLESNEKSFLFIGYNDCELYIENK